MSILKTSSNFSSTYSEFYNQLKTFNNINGNNEFNIKKSFIHKKISGELIKIVPISDIHFGHKNCNVKKLEDMIQFVLNTEDCYTILLGDQTECATKTSIGMATFEQVLDLGDQIKGLVELFSPLAKAGKILGVCTGNHEYRVMQFAGVDPAQILASKLDVDYLGWQGYIGLEINDIKYDISAFHGVGGGVAKSSKIKSVAKISDITDCDLYIIGHFHDKIDDESVRYRFNYKTKELEEYTRKYALCGSFLEYWGGYSEMKALCPSRTGSPLITLDGTKKDIKIYK